MQSFRFKFSLSFGWWRSVRYIWWILSCSHNSLLTDSYLAGKSCGLCVLCLHCCVLTVYGLGAVWWVGWYRKWGRGLRRQSKSSAWSTGGQWGSPPEPAKSLHLEWPWSSHLDLSERCHCQCRGRWGQYLRGTEKTGKSNTTTVVLDMKIFNTVTLLLRSGKLCLAVAFRKFTLTQISKAALIDWKTHSPDSLYYSYYGADDSESKS